MGVFDNGKSRIASAAVGQKQPADCAEALNALLCLHQGAPLPSSLSHLTRAAHAGAGGARSRAISDQDFLEHLSRHRDLGHLERT